MNYVPAETCFFLASMTLLMGAAIGVFYQRLATAEKLSRAMERLNEHRAKAIVFQQQWAEDIADNYLRQISEIVFLKELGELELPRAISKLTAGYRVLLARTKRQDLPKHDLGALFHGVAKTIESAPSLGISAEWEEACELLRAHGFKPIKGE